MIDTEILRRLSETIAARRGAEANSSYVESLFAKGHDAVLRKVAEEATETLLASKDGDKLHVVREMADLWFHSMVLLAGWEPAATVNGTTSSPPMPATNSSAITLLKM